MYRSCTLSGTMAVAPAAWRPSRAAKACTAPNVRVWPAHACSRFRPVRRRRGGFEGGGGARHEARRRGHICYSIAHVHHNAGCGELAAHKRCRVASHNGVRRHTQRRARRSRRGRRRATLLRQTRRTRRRCLRRSAKIQVRLAESHVALLQAPDVPPPSRAQRWTPRRHFGRRMPSQRRWWHATGCALAARASRRC